MAVWVTSTRKGVAASGAKMKPAPKRKPTAGYKPGPPGRAVVSKPGTPAGVPTSGPGAAAGASAAAANAGLVRPIDPFYDAAVAAAQRDYSQAMQGAEYRRGQLGSTFGLGLRPDGGVYDDPSNPFSQAAAMHAAFVQNKSGALNSYAARGQLYSGAHQSMQDEARRVHEQNRDRLIREFYAANAGITQDTINAGNALTDRVTAADEASMARALADRPDPESVAPAAGAAPKAGFKFVMNSGPRAGQSYNLVPGKGPQKGKLVRQYEDGHREAR